MYEVVLGIIVILAMILSIFYQKENNELKKENNALIKEKKLLGAIKESVDKIVESQRLSMILKLEPSSLKIDPANFEPNKEEVKVKLLELYEKEKHPCIETMAYVILYWSGWYSFVDSQTCSSAKMALVRLLTNSNKEATLAFLNEIVDKL